jgi:hypothetical protein
VTFRQAFFAVTTVALAIMLALTGMPIPPVTAQEATTPQATPTVNGGDAVWTIGEVTFASDYPNGGTFTIQAESTGGAIKTATVFFRHNPSNRQRALGEFDSDNNRWVARGVPADTPQWVAIDYWWSLTDAAGNNYVTDIVNDVYSDTRREWNFAESEDIIVYWEMQLPPNMGDAIIEAMADRRQFYQDNWGQLLPYRPRAIIFDGEDDMVINEWRRGATIRRPGVGGGAATILGGFTTRAYGAFIGIYRQSREDPVEFAAETVLHEVGHLYQYENGGFDAQFWFQEGNAEFMVSMERSRRNYLRRAQSLAARGDLPPLAELGGREAYDVGFAFFVWFTEKYGPDSHLKLMQLVGQGMGTRRALERFTGVSFFEIETEFRTWLGAPDPLPPTPLPEPTIAFAFPSPTFAPTRTPRP